MNILKDCTLCPRKCHVNRYKTVGYCHTRNKIKIALVSLHYWEEPFISGTKGSGTIFFSYCNLGCIYCQNKKIRNGFGKEITINRFSQICLEQQERGALNINLVTPTHYAPLIKKGIEKAKQQGLKIPIIYNTGSYESVNTIKMMNNIVDIYLADLKYYDNKLGEKYSHCKDYFKYASAAIEEMYNQVGTPIIENDILKKGLVVRVLIIPGEVEDSKKIIRYLYNRYKDNIYISIMNQYTPIEKYKYCNLNRKVSDDEYNEVIEYAISLGINNAFIQEGETQDESFIPDFNLTNV